MNQDNAFDGSQYYEDVAQWAICAGQWQNEQGETIETVIVYIKTEEGTEHRFMLSGSMPAEWINALIAASMHSGA